MKFSVGLRTFVGGLKTKKSLRPGWLGTNQGLKTKKSLRPGQLGTNQGKTEKRCEVKVVVIYANIT